MIHMYGIQNQNFNEYTRYDACSTLFFTKEYLNFITDHANHHLIFFLHSEEHQKSDFFVFVSFFINKFSLMNFISVQKCFAWL